MVGSCEGVGLGVSSLIDPVVVANEKAKPPH